MYVKGLSMHTVHSVAQCERIMEMGWKNRSVGYTLMNKDSSRSHSIFTINIEIYAVGMWGRTGRRGLGDLSRVPAAGSQGGSPPRTSGAHLSLGRMLEPPGGSMRAPRPHARTHFWDEQPNSNSSDAGSHHRALTAPCMFCACSAHERGWGLQDGASLRALS